MRMSTMRDESTTSKLWPRLPLRVFAYDLVNVACLLYFWTEVIGAADRGVFLGLTLTRVAVTYAYLSVLFDPVRRWQTRGFEVDDRELLAVDEALRRNRPRFVVAYVTLWVATLLLSLVLAKIGVPVAKPLGVAEILNSLLFALAIALAVAPVQQALVDGATSEAQIALSAELAKRKLQVQRPSTTIVSSMLMMHLTATLGIFIGVSALGSMVRVQSVRAALLSEQERRAEIAALEQRWSGKALDPELTLVRADELPSILVGVDDPATSEVLSAHDLEASETLAAAPVGDGRWVLARAHTDEQLGPSIVFLVILLVVITGALSVANLVFSRSLAIKLRELRSATRRVVEDGEIRTIARVIPLRNDEVGMLVHDFNGMLDVFEELATAAQKVAAGDLRVEFERPGDLHDAFRSMVARLDEMVVEIRVTALELASAAAQIHAVTRTQEQAAEQQSTSVREVGATAASLANAAKEIAVSAELVLDNADRALSTTDLMIGRIAELTSEANGVGDLLETIRDVADRSDLLALNGSLEATRAGEAGRGFALVAAEMRRLAERVNGSVADVRGRVTSIERAGTSTVLATEEAKQLAERTAAAAQQISSVTAQQSRDTQQVSQAIEEVAAIAIATAAATAQTRAAAQQLEAKAGQLEQLTRRFEPRRAMPTAAGAQRG